ncbi:MAG TPA: hypothetical protein VGC55_06170, partial [Dokdonella sp.]
MSVADRLRALQRQAGRATIAPPSSAGDVRATLRRLLGTRQRSFPARSPLAAPVGIEIGKGLHLVEHSYAWEGPASLAMP